MITNKSDRVYEIQSDQGWTDETLLEFALEYINNAHSEDNPSIYNINFEDWLQERADEENQEFASSNEDDKEPEFIEVEYDTDFYGGDYSYVGEMVMIPAELANRVGMGMAFRQTTGFDPIHIIHYNPDERYNKDGDLIE